MKILITGASGFVGQHLAQYIGQKKRVCIGSYRTHRPPKHLFKKTYHCDFSSFGEVLRLIKRVRPTHIFHLVGQSSPSLSWKKPFDTFVDNALSTLHLAEACRQAHLKPLIILSSSAHVYGSICYRRRIPTESDFPTPMDPYGAAKIYAEEFLRQYRQQFHIPFIVIRATAHVGVGQPSVFAISNFALQIAKIEKGYQAPVIRVGNLKTERGFIPVDDMIRAYWLVLRKGKAGQLYNISAQQVEPMAHWLDLLLKMSTKKIKVIQEKTRLNLIEIPKLRVSSQKFRRLTGWRETHSLKQVFQDVLNWHRSHV
ncbi:MAG: hypothetical protein COV74_09200 [Candidatus Omnitrophica bacterium CG11_big_fil_rev_8_21_14_0_20_45_26]|uniref:NAD-dependent epimerase/dehydratase domain-containing protein n=1 Tax=Candidatus Abzuiibacterium crystallinum TaxID=1974748 RepID=A0A2H0LPD2_9BACT|nr:MAG: hypothetical protein COV74_09200 [Candidatus Omnitrophica bacterium CG11_big_fil_rev_8_21_14_0_20_45_26]PIW63247.1 MAG: hypothetical protein COW12_11175 [Candidatus Omnitrophica bacterium CG12_big_fil_rev_8_21_14_0_65_45_16]